MISWFLVFYILYTSVVETTWSRPDIISILGIEFAEVLRAYIRTQASKK
jgi:hypothetical protein